MVKLKPLPWSAVKSWFCTRCGECCQLIVQLTAQEWINLTRKYGYAIFEPDIGGFFIRKTLEGACPFLCRTYNGRLCVLQREKPLACKLWPFKILAEPKYGLPDEAVYNYMNNRFYIYAIPNCPGFSWGKPSEVFVKKTLPEFIEIQLGFREQQRFSTAPLYSQQ